MISPAHKKKKKYISFKYKYFKQKYSITFNIKTPYLIIQILKIFDIVITVCKKNNWKKVTKTDKSSLSPSILICIIYRAHATVDHGNCIKISIFTFCLQGRLWMMNIADTSLWFFCVFCFRKIPLICCR